MSERDEFSTVEVVNTDAGLVARFKRSVAFEIKNQYMDLNEHNLRKRIAHLNAKGYDSSMSDLALAELNRMKAEGPKLQA